VPRFSGVVKCCSAISTRRIARILHTIEADRIIDGSLGVYHWIAECQSQLPSQEVHRRPAICLHFHDRVLGKIDPTGREGEIVYSRQDDTNNRHCDEQFDNSIAFVRR
jgi:hypothetical protein